MYLPCVLSHFCRQHLSLIFHFIFHHIAYAELVVFQHVHRWCPLRLLQLPVGGLNLHQKLYCITTPPLSRVSVANQLTRIQLEERSANLSIANLCLPATNPCFRCASCTGDIMPPITWKAPRSIKWFLAISIELIKCYRTAFTVMLQVCWLTKHAQVHQSWWIERTTSNQY